MVLHGKLCGRVGRCRHYFDKARGLFLGPFFWPPSSLFLVQNALVIQARRPHGAH
jgi:hypothetical protein